MTPTRATIMTLFQCRPLWFWHVWGAIICLVAILTPLGSAERREGALFTILVVPMWTGVITASLAKDFLARPFTFGLPLHDKSWRQTLFLIGIAVAVVCAFVTLVTPSDSAGVGMQRAWLALFLCMAMFVTGALAVMSLPNTGFLPAVVTLILVIGLNDGVALHLRLNIERVLTASPLATTIVCALAVAVAWRRLGSRAVARKICGQPFLPFHGSFSGEKQRNYNAARKMRQTRRSNATIVTSLERFFLARMQRLGNQPTLRAFFGTLYIQTGAAAPARASHFFALSILLIAVTILPGFYGAGRGEGEVSGANLVVFLLCILNAEYRINPHATLLLNVGRKVRFRSLMFSALSQTFVIAAASVVLTAISIAAGHYLHEVTLYGETFTYVPISPKAFLVFAPMLPFLFISQLLYPKHHVLVVIFIASIATISFMTVGYKLLYASWLSLILMQVFCWLPFVVIARYLFYSLDLKLTEK